jgi:signal transduction histidine kinase
VRRLTGETDEQVATLYTPLLVQGRNEGTLAVSLRTEPAFGSVRSAALRLALIVLAAMLGIVGIGAVLSRYILGQVRPLLDALRSLGSGDLGARAHRVGDDELGQLADGVNTMASQLQTSYETLEQRVEERTEEVQRLLRERTQFFAAMSHEFRTPVAVVLSQAQMLSDPQFPKSDRWQVDAGRILRTSGEQLLSLVSDILELAKAEVGKLEVELGEVSVPAVVKELKPTIEGLAHAADLRAKVSVPARLPAVLADQQRLRQVLLNLVDNAVKYTPRGGTVTVSAMRTDSKVEIAVADTGVGIPAEHADRIFEPFFRVRTNRTQGGQPSSGLGLAVTKRLVEAQGGTIRFTSTPGEGTTFVVTLPVSVPSTVLLEDASHEPPALARPAG